MNCQEFVDAASDCMVLLGISALRRLSFGFGGFLLALPLFLRSHLLPVSREKEIHSRRAQNNDQEKHRRDKIDLGSRSLRHASSVGLNRKTFKSPQVAIADSKLGIQDHKFQISDFRFEISDLTSELWNPKSGNWNHKPGVSNSNFEMYDPESRI